MNGGSLRTPVRREQHGVAHLLANPVVHALVDKVAFQPRLRDVRLDRSADSGPRALSRGRVRRDPSQRSGSEFSSIAAPIPPASGWRCCRLPRPSRSRPAQARTPSSSSTSSKSGLHYVTLERVERPSIAEKHGHRDEQIAEKFFRLFGRVAQKIGVIGECRGLANLHAPEGRAA